MIYNSIYITLDDYYNILINDNKIMLIRAMYQLPPNFLNNYLGSNLLLVQCYDKLKYDFSVIKMIDTT